jgi:hypothetical protein
VARRKGKLHILVNEGGYLAPAGKTALVPVTRKPAIGMTATAPSTHAVPVTPLLANVPERRIGGH